MSRIMACCF